VTPAEAERHYLVNPRGKTLGAVFLALDGMLRAAEPLFPPALRRRAIAAAVDFFTQRLNGEHGLGGIFPAMANALMAYDTLGYPRDHAHVTVARRAIDGLLVFENGHAYCQPCLSPVWDTALAAHALMEAGEEKAGPVLRRAPTGWPSGRFSTSMATGPPRVPACGREAGRSNTRIPIIRTWTTPLP
jgi:Squalene cyclase